jgi:hypothetical protein
VGVRPDRLEVVDDGPGVGVADGHHDAHPLLGRHLQGEPRVEAQVPDHDREGARQQGREDQPEPASVHERAEAERARDGRALLDAGGHVVEVSHRLDAEGRVAASADGRQVDVLVPPHHALGHAGRATGPQAVEVVGRALADVGRRVGLAGQRLLVAGVGHQHLAAAVEPGRGPAGPVLQVRLGDDDDQVGVVEQVGELLVDVAEVHVHRDGPQLVGRQRGLDVLVAVVEVTPDVVADADAEGGQRVGEPVGPGIELGEGEPELLALRRPHDQRGVVRHGAHHRLEDVGHVQTHRPPRVVVASSLRRPTDRRPGRAGGEGGEGGRDRRSVVVFRRRRR